MVDLDIQNPYEYESIPSESELQQWVEAAIQGSYIEHDFSVVVRFVNEMEGLALNQAYRKKKYATNVLSFPFDEPEFTTEISRLDEELSEHLQQQHLGDIVLCEKVVKKESKEQGKVLVQHWAHMIIHGVLHLQGYDHLTDEEANLMEALEVRILDSLGFDNPY